ncbi:MAG: hypothetical protein AB3N18_14055 [Allomuricauda sp.]
MKPFIALLFAMFSLPLFSQIEKVVGEYNRKLGGGDHIDKYTLTLNEDGTFFFHAYRNAKYGRPPIVHKYAKGTWSVEVKKKYSTDNILVLFSTDKEKDFDEKYTLDFNSSKARLIIKSPRDKTDREIKEKLQFYKSNIFWIETIDMFKG